MTVRRVGDKNMHIALWETGKTPRQLIGWRQSVDTEQSMGTRCGHLWYLWLDAVITKRAMKGNSGKEML
jgi:hypothetical protein